MRITDVEIDSDLEELVPQFIENRKKDISDLKDLVQKKDLEGIAHVSHKVKGVAAGYGFIVLSELASKMEVALKEQNLDQLEPLVDEMETHFSNIRVRYVNQ